MSGESRAADVSGGGELAWGLDWQQANMKLRQGSRTDMVRCDAGMRAPEVEVRINNAARRQDLQVLTKVFIFGPGV